MTRGWLVTIEKKPVVVVVVKVADLAARVTI